MELPLLLIAVALPVLLLLSVPIGVALGLSVVIAVVAGDIPVQFLMQKMFFSLDTFPLLAVPFFIMAGEIMQKGSMAEALLRLSRCLIGHITGGLAQVSVLTCMFYGALSLAFAASKFANRLKPLLAKGLRRTAILVVLLQNLVLFGRLNNPWWRFNFQ